MTMILRYIATGFLLVFNYTAQGADAAPKTPPVHVVVTIAPHASLVAEECK